MSRVTPYDSGDDDGAIARQHLPRNGEERQQLVVPVQRLEVHQHGAAGVGDIGDVHTAARSAGQIPQHPGVGGAEDRVAAFGGGAHAVDVLQDPLHLAAGEVGRRRQTGLLPDHIAAAVAVQRRRDAVGAGVLPDDRVVVRPAGALVPHQRRLALVGDAQRGKVAGGQIASCSAPTSAPTRCAPRSRPGCARPSPPAAGSARARADGGRPRRRRGRRSCSGCWWCPGRSRRRTLPPANPVPPS